MNKLRNQHTSNIGACTGVPDESPDPASNEPTLRDRLVAEPDLVDRIFDYVVALLPELGPRHVEVKLAVRAEFAGDRAYVLRRDRNGSHPLARQVLSLFNGRNATEVARELHISRATVYRVLKQPGTLK